MCISFASVCVYVMHTRARTPPHVHVWYMQSSEEGIRFPITEVTHSSALYKNST